MLWSIISNALKNKVNNEIKKESYCGLSWKQIHYDAMLIA